MIATQEQIAKLSGISLSHGAHGVGNEMCAMEAAAFIAGEPWSDRPQCVCPALGAFMRAWNDSLRSNEERDRILLPLLPVVLNTKGSSALAERRGYMALDWLVRVFTPKWLDLSPKLASHAKALRDLDEITDLAGATAAGVITRAAWDAAWDAAGAAAGGAAWDAAIAAAWAAAGDAARDAAGDAARAAAMAAAWAAAMAAAWAAARDAAGDALKPTTEWLQTSASELVRRMAAEPEPHQVRA